MFLDACRASPSVELRVNSEVDSYEQDASSVTVRLASGETVVGDALIGADGLWSKVRRQVVGDGPPRVSGHTTYRSVIPTEQMPEDLRWNAATLWAGPRCHAVHYPLSGWKVFNLVVTYHNDAPEPVAGKPVSEEEVIAGFTHTHPRVQAIIRHGSDWKLWVLCDRDPVLNWTDGRVALLGDAAHPMLQYFAQGACMAMEDAVCISDLAEKHVGDFARVFEAYRQQRVLRATRVQLQSRAIGEHIYHPSGAHAALRNAIMRAKTPDDWFDTLAWLYGGSGLTASAKRGSPPNKNRPCGRSRRLTRVLSMPRATSHRAEHQRNAEQSKRARLGHQEASLRHRRRARPGSRCWSPTPFGCMNIT